MSSFIRRLQRQVVPSREIHRELDLLGEPTGKLYANPARQKFFRGRGSKLGVPTNPEGRDLLARLKREEGKTT